MENRKMMEKILDPETMRLYDLRKGTIKAETLGDLNHLFVKVCVNSYPAITINGTRQLYRHPDLDKFSQLTFDKNERFFYCEPVNPKNPNGAQKLIQPKYEYKLARSLTEEEFNTLFK